MRPAVTKFVRTVCLLLGGLFVLALGQALISREGPPPASVKSLDRLESLIRSHAFKDADRLAAEILADPAADTPARAVCGLAILKLGRIRDAEAILDKVVAAEPGNPEAHLGLGRIDVIRNNVEAALPHLRRAVPSVRFYEEALRLLW